MRIKVRGSIYNGVWYVWVTNHSSLRYSRGTFRVSSLASYEYPASSMNKRERYATMRTLRRAWELRLEAEAV